jgi:preprotein translocase subunit YajC
MKNKSIVGPIVLITLGIYFLALKQGWVPNLGSLVSEWWPVILIIVGFSLLLSRSSRN